MNDYRIRPKKSLGQHFLIDKNIVEKILKVADIRPDDTIVEIGPGRGIMTWRLTEVAKRIIAIELDDRLFSYLNENLKGISNLELVQGDALRFNYEDILEEFKVIANLPYYISTPIIFKLLSIGNKIRSMTLMLQKEVAERIVAPPGTKEYGPLSVSVAYYCEPRIEFFVSRRSFSPQPKVDSAVITLLARREPKIKVKDVPLFFKTIRAGFSPRRKMLKNALRGITDSMEIIETVLERSGIDPRRRGETLSIEEFATLADNLFDTLY